MADIGELLDELSAVASGRPAPPRKPITPPLATKIDPLRPPPNFTDCAMCGLKGTPANPVKHAGLLQCVQALRAELVTKTGDTRYAPQ